MHITNLTTRLGSITIREGVVTDIEQFRELRLDALQESPTAFPGLIQRTSTIRGVFGKIG
jgi:hypothetical protein